MGDKNKRPIVEKELFDKKYKRVFWCQAVTEQFWLRRNKKKKKNPPLSD